MRLFILILFLAVLPIILFFYGVSLPVLWTAWGVSSIGVVWFLFRRIARAPSEPVTPGVDKNLLKNDTAEPQKPPAQKESARIPQPIAEKQMVNVERKFLTNDLEESETSYKTREAE